MRRLLEQHHTKIRFLVVGAVNTLFGIGLFVLLMLAGKHLHIHYLVISSTAQIVAILFSFFTNRTFVFKARGSIRHELPVFCAPYLGYFFLNLATLPLLVEVAHLNPLVAQTGFTLTVLVTNYLWHSRVTFRSR